MDGKLLTDIDVTTEYLSSKDDYVALYEWLCVRKEIEQKTFLKYPAFGLKKEIENYRWNYVEGKSYPCNETRSLILHYLEKAGISSTFYQQRSKNRCGIYYIL